MAKSGRTQEQLNNLAHRQYVAWALGDGVKTEFPLPKRILRLDDLIVSVSGSIQQPATPSVPNAYAVRGLTAGYAGDSNFVKFTAAPPVGAAIGFIINAD